MAYPVGRGSLQGMNYQAMESDDEEFCEKVWKVAQCIFCCIGCPPCCEDSSDDPVGSEVSMKNAKFSADPNNRSRTISSLLEPSTSGANFPSSDSSVSTSSTTDSRIVRMKSTLSDAPVSCTSSPGPGSPAATD